MVACRRDPGGQRTVGRQLHEEEMNTQSVCVGGGVCGIRREEGGGPRHGTAVWSRGLS